MVSLFYFFNFRQKTMDSKEILAGYLLKVQAVQLSPNHPFKWASGILSPIYTDNRRLLSFPLIREYITDYFVRIIREKFPHVQYVAGVATSAIAWAGFVAQRLGLPMVYVRPKAKDHGLQNKIEGFIPAGSNALVIEDLVSTGGSSLTAVQTLRENGINVIGLLAIFSYQLEIAQENISQVNIDLVTLTDYVTLVEKALEMEYITAEELTILKKWRKNPQTFYSSSPS